MPLTSWSVDDELTAARLNEMVDAFNGIASLTDGTYGSLLTLPSGLTVTRNADAWALTVKNTHTNWKGLDVQDGSGNSVLNTQKTSGGNICVSINTQNAAVPANTQVLIAAANARSAFTMTDISYVNTATSNPSNDVSALRVIARQNSGNAYIRPLEVHMLGKSGDNTLPKMAMEVTAQFSYAGNALDRTGAISIQNLSQAWPEVLTPHRADYGIKIGGDYDGFENGILYQDTLSQSARTLFQARSDGLVGCLGIVPLASAQYDNGGASNLWKVTYSQSLKVSPGSAGAPAILSTDDADTGIFWASTGTVIGFSTNGTERMRLATLLDFTESTMNVANGTTAIITLGNYGGTGRPTAAAQSGWLKVKIGGTDSWLPYWR